MEINERLIWNGVENNVERMVIGKNNLTTKVPKMHKENVYGTATEILSYDFQT